MDESAEALSRGSTQERQTLIESGRAELADAGAGQVALDQLRWLYHLKRRIVGAGLLLGQEEILMPRLVDETGQD